MSDKDFLKKVYDLRGPQDVRDYYDRWSDSYDSELKSQGYATPARCAAALRAAGTAADAAILDFGCGTGVSGEAFVAEGFSCIDGCDLSAEMLAQAQAKGLYRKTSVVQPDADVPSGYDVIAAVGVIGVGAAPPETLARAYAALGSGGRLVFSFNDHALADPRFSAQLQQVRDAGARVLFEEYGDHIPGIGIFSTVYVLEKP